MDQYTDTMLQPVESLTSILPMFSTTVSCSLGYRSRRTSRRHHTLNQLGVSEVDGEVLVVHASVGSTLQALEQELEQELERLAVLAQISAQGVPAVVLKGPLEPVGLVAWTAVQGGGGSEPAVGALEADRGHFRSQFAPAPARSCLEPLRPQPLHTWMRRQWRTPSLSQLLR